MTDRTPMTPVRPGSGTAIALRMPTSRSSRRCSASTAAAATTSSGITVNSSLTPVRRTAASPCGASRGGRVGAHEPPRPLRLVRVGVRDADRRQLAVLDQHQRAPVRQPRDEQRSDRVDGLLEVQARGQGHRGVGEERQPLGRCRRLLGGLGPLERLGQGVREGLHEPRLGVLVELATRREAQAEQPEAVLADDQRHDVQHPVAVVDLDPARGSARSSARGCAAGAADRC